MGGAGSCGRVSWEPGRHLERGRWIDDGVPLQRDRRWGHRLLGFLLLLPVLVFAGWFVTWPAIALTALGLTVSSWAWIIAGGADGLLLVVLGLLLWDMWRAGRH